MTTMIVLDFEQGRAMRFENRCRVAAREITGYDRYEDGNIMHELLFALRMWSPPTGGIAA